MQSLLNSTNTTPLPDAYRWALLSIYTVVLVGGTISMSLMINILQSNVRSITTTAVINLIIVHILFLLTVPFRIYFYAFGDWQLGQGFCRVVSSMVHAHILLTFVFYVIILVIRYLAFYNGNDRMEFYRTMHAMWILAQVYRKHQNQTFSHQEFWAQVKSLSFVAVMLVCFVPYNVFRVYYVQNMNAKANLEGVNEVFLAITTLSCLDMLTFVGTGSKSPCRAGFCCCTL
ncbi:putative G-protein coupled receptor 141 [Diretmus argenteus]